MREWVFKEIPPDDVDNSKRIIHVVKLPSFGEPGFYQQTVSLTYFREGKRAGATKRQQILYTDTCCWKQDGTLFFCIPKEQWEAEDQREVASFKRQGVTDWISELTLPRIEHETIYAFYEYIGFDRKRRKYIK
jgi:hypothetical protein